MDDKARNTDQNPEIQPFHFFFFNLFKRVCHDLIHCRTRLCDYMTPLINSLIQGLGAGTRNFLYLNGRLHQKHAQNNIRELILLRNHSSDKKEEKISFERLGTLTCIHNKSHLPAVFSKAVIWLSECFFNPCCRSKNTASKTVSIQVNSPKIFVEVCLIYKELLMQN